MRKNFSIKNGDYYNVVSLDVNEAREIGRWASAVDLADWIMSYPELYGIENYDEAIEIAYEAREIVSELITGEDEDLAVRQVIKKRRSHEK